MKDTTDKASKCGRMVENIYIKWTKKKKKTNIYAN